MSDISELERRIHAALDRIGAGLESLGRAGAVDAAGMAAMAGPEGTGDVPPAPPDSDEATRLAEELAAEREANLQLEERVKAIREKQETTVARLEREVSALREELAGHSAAMQKIRRVNAQLRENNRALREANAGGLAEPHLINKSMLAELDALRSAREADRAELDEILGELAPLVDGGEHA